MNTLIETIIYLIAIIGIVAIIGSFFEIFSNSHLDYFKRTPDKIFDFRKKKIDIDKTIRVDVYLNNMSSEETDKASELIKKNEVLNEIADYINIYKTFDKK